MPDTNTKLKPADSTGRVDLKHAIDAVSQAKTELAELERGQTSAREKSWELSSKVEAAQEHLAKLKADEQRRLASAWVDNDSVDASPVPAAEHALTQARNELDHIRRVETALAAEIPATQRHLNDCQRNLYAVLAEAVCSSDEYEALRQAHTDAWRNLRTIRECLKVTHSALKGQVSQAYLDAGQRAEASFRQPGFPVDEARVQRWSDALANLERDPDAPLPSI